MKADSFVNFPKSTASDQLPQNSDLEVASAYDNKSGGNGAKPSYEFFAKSESDGNPFVETSL